MATKKTDARKRSKKTYPYDVRDIVKYIEKGRKKEPMSKLLLGTKYIEGQRELRKMVIDQAAEKILEND